MTDGVTKDAAPVHSRRWRWYFAAIAGFVATYALIWVAVLKDLRGSPFRWHRTNDGAILRKYIPRKAISMFASDNQSTSQKIPRLIHQSWKNIDYIPDKFEPWMHSWRVKNPTFDYMFWDDDDNLKLFEVHFPQYYPMARQLRKIHLADMTRYALLYRYGGVYADLDFESLASFEDLLHYDLFLSYEPFVHSVLLEGASEPVLCNAILASRPGHPFWIEVLDRIKTMFETSDDRDPVSLTGPRMVQGTVSARHGNLTDIALLSEEYFYPDVAYWNMGNLENNCKHMKDKPQSVKDACAWLQKYPMGRKTNNTHAVHHWQCTWCRGDNTNSYLALDDIFPRQVVYRPHFDDSIVL
ncbi:hypothetical protein Ae201684P_007933 [Aphanomyces euteiches]|uniref:Uncharacterized protein n=1 Tax=Aphanomyces euteiches TaxID=100861 RepID=A0A6G0WLW4_9STRA|nr:hypothetical protein Ae201684_013844 [Aphanomyces euteiches]KAH9080847.1 hypothetical protein Ae201684P_007933 [Aphanomyces euteiches]KAH9151271.1 hypothetical protein AeRB84_006081 [Aphanomyces euteiches]